MIDINNYNEELRCSYKGEIYCVRDNGAILRLPKVGTRKRKLDNTWTYGNKSPQSGYMLLNNVRVHQIVATAFHGKPDNSNMVVDHKDTNRCNNRPSNLRWVTRLENILNNPITRKKIIYYCGSIEAFLNNPATLKDVAGEPNFNWMRTVTLEEAEMCKNNLERWAQEDNKQYYDFKKEKFDNSIFNEQEPNIPISTELLEWEKALRPIKPIPQQVESKSPQLHIGDNITYVKSLTPTALQDDWATPTEYPLCPKSVTTLEDYMTGLKINAVFCRNQYAESTVVNFALNPDQSKLYICTHIESKISITEWALACVYIKGYHYIHKSERTYFEKKGMEKDFTLLQGKVWEGGECIDDYL